MDREELGLVVIELQRVERHPALNISDACLQLSDGV